MTSEPGASCGRRGCSDGSILHKGQWIAGARVLPGRAGRSAICRCLHLSRSASETDTRRLPGGMPPDRCARLANQGHLHPPSIGGACLALTTSGNRLTSGAYRSAMGPDHSDFMARLRCARVAHPHDRSPVSMLSIVVKRFSSRVVRCKIAEAATPRQPADGISISGVRSVSQRYCGRPGCASGTTVRLPTIRTACSHRGRGGAGQQANARALASEVS